MKKIRILLLSVIGLITIAYFLGPKPEPPSEFNETFTFPPISELDSFIQNRELAIKGLKEGNQAKIVWNDSLVIYTRG